MTRILIFLACAVSAFATWTADTTISPQTNGATWQPPIGIPAPTFGITETRPARPDPWTSDVANYYYVQAGGTNMNEGYPGNPRATVPASPAAGSVIEVHGDYAHGGNDLTLNWTNGTSGNPIYLCGQDAENIPNFKCDTYIPDGAKYITIEYIKTMDRDGNLAAGDGGYIYVSANSASVPHHIVVRHCEVTGNLAGSGGIISASFNGTDWPQDIVIWDNYVHDCGDWSVFEGDQDRHGIHVAATRAWIVDNEMTHCSGDGSQIGGGATAESLEINHIYLGRNYAHENKQGGIWVKQSTHIVISQNVIRDAEPSESSPAGAGIGFQYDPENIEILFNDVKDCYTGIWTGQGDVAINGTNCRVVGNLIRDILNEGITIRGSRDWRVVNNTLRNCGSGVLTQGAYKLNFENNIISGLTDTLFLQIEDVMLSGSTVKNNIFHGSSGTPHFMWEGANYNSLAAFQAGTSKGQDCLTSDPLFVSASDSHLQAGSPAVGTALADTNLTVDVYDEFQDTYSLNIGKDFDGGLRPAGGTWEIGFDEYGAAAGGSVTFSGAGSTSFSGGGTTTFTTP